MAVGSPAGAVRAQWTQTRAKRQQRQNGNGVKAAAAAANQQPGNAKWPTEKNTTQMEQVSTQRYKPCQFNLQKGMLQHTRARLRQIVPLSIRSHVCLNFTHALDAQTKRDHMA